MIANVPQGLPLTVTACLQIIAERMGEQNVFVKKLDTIETLGSCSLICTDKTGTLTLNQMSVSNIWYMNQLIDEKDAIELNNIESKSNNQQHSQFKQLMDVAILNSRVTKERKDPDDINSELVPDGDATELGIYRYFSKTITDRTGLEIEDYRNKNKKIHVSSHLSGRLLRVNQLRLYSLLVTALKFSCHSA
jgi:sodium/potassium-transporting ATPase subunit alpha